MDKLSIMKWKDVLRPISGFFFIQPFVIIWLVFTESDPANAYMTTGWLFQVYMTILFIPYYAWYERVWSEKPKKTNIWQ